MAVTAQLYRLEELDTELERRGAELTEARVAQRRNRELEAAEARLEELRSQEREASAEQRALEVELEQIEGKIARDQKRMYGGQIVDPRELASLERELEHYRTQRGDLEERLLLAMERLEGIQEALRSWTERLREVRERWEAQKPILARQIEGITASLASLRAERESLAGSIDPPALNLYGRLRSSSQHAVSHVSNGVCQWCRVTIPSKDVQHARSGSLVTCSNCARVLYVGG
jgi:uncharacterized protein